MVHKDVGLIPYFLACSCGWTAEIAYFEQDEPVDGRVEEAFTRWVTLTTLGKTGGKLSSSCRVPCSI